MSITVLQTTLSTNLDAKEARYRHGDVIVAIEQTAGRGQRGHKWSSHAGENLTFSLVWEPTFLPATRQFLLSECVALALCDTLSGYGIDARIKWTNDIYVGERKICGILIEHEVSGSNLKRTVVGIGLNVNQTSFEEWIPNPTSMSLLCGGRREVMSVLNEACAALAGRYAMLEDGEADRIEADYHKLLYRLDTPHTFALPDGSRFEGVIRSVEPSGALCVECGTQTRQFLFKEIEFVI